jgi:ribosomal protein L16 Arg81 hydroxylase
MSDWLYQVRLKLSEELSNALRENQATTRADQLRTIASNYNMNIVCTLDAFQEYCNEAEENGIENYLLYEWTKEVINDPVKQQKHSKSFALYKGLEQVYEKKIAIRVYQKIDEIKDELDILEVKLIDSNPANNPQPPKMPNKT